MDIDKMRELSQKIHSNAIAKGFWEDKREPAEIVALIHSELSEALEEYREFPSRVSQVFNVDGKPCGFPVELADVIIRILDWVGHDDVPLVKTYCKGEITGHIPYDIGMMHLRVSHALVGAIAIDGNKTVIGYDLSRLIAMIEKLAELQGIPIWEVVEQKHKYNLTRPYKHGKVC